LRFFFATPRFPFGFDCRFEALVDFFFLASTIAVARTASERVVFTIVPATLPISRAMVFSNAFLGGADFFFIDLSLDG
jgi:hypothetical protein